MRRNMNVVSGFTISPFISQQRIGEKIDRAARRRRIDYQVAAFVGSNRLAGLWPK